MSSKREKSLIVKYLVRMTGLSRKQIGRYVTMLKAGKRPHTGQYLTRHYFAKEYKQKDIELLAEVDNATDRLSGGLTVAFMKNQYNSGDERFARIKEISVAHLYRLMGTRTYGENALNVSCTKSTQVSIGKREKPRPNGVPGHIRVDTVHQGDLKGIHGIEKGVYHINFVDEVTQWEITLAVECISESYLLPILKMALEYFPFIIINFHSDNGSEFINYTVSHLLNKLNIAQTKSRARTSTDNGLVESKNGAIIRKEFGHWHIPGNQAGLINQFYREHLIPYLNYHRPCHFPIKTQNQTNGKITITYPLLHCQTPYQKLLSLPHWKDYLKSGISPESLKQAAEAKTPLQAAEDKKKARTILMKLVLPKYSDILPTLSPPMTL